MAKKDNTPILPQEESASYNNSSIRSLKGPDRVRKRPGVIFGSDGLQGCQHSFFEILSNAVDEAREGYGKEIIITVSLDHTLQVEDHGRGVPLGYNKAEKRWNWDLIYCELYAGGKYENNNKNGQNAYTFSLGLNGLGACATQYSAEFMDVVSRDGVTESSIHFKEGVPVTELKQKKMAPGDTRTGTTVRWRPDLQVFTDIAIPDTYFDDLLHRQSVVNAGISFILHTERQDAPGTYDEKIFLYPNGISDYISEIAGENTITKPVLWHMESSGRDRDDKDDYRLMADIAFCASTTTNKLEYYHNSSFLEHNGSPDRAVKVAFASAVDKRLRTTGKYNKTEAKIIFQDIQDCLVLVINSFSTLTSYENQTKKSITNTFIYESMAEFLKNQLESYFKERPTEADRFCNQVLINKRSREQAESTRLNIKKKLTGVIDIANRVEKFVSCRSKDPNRREIYIVEGDSALTSCKLGRDSEFQAIIPIRGKTLNCLKADYPRIFKSDIITDLIKVIGCGVEISSKVKGDLPVFDMDSLRWSKIILCTDADEDGFQIRTLLLTMFYRLMPTLLAENKVFIAESPLFEITTKNETYFAFDEFEKADLMKKLEGQKYTLQRSKGLGENEPEMMWRTTMNPASRRLISVTPADAKETAKIFDTLLGDNLAARKKYIAAYGREYIKNADIS